MWRRLLFTALAMVLGLGLLELSLRLLVPEARLLFLWEQQDSPFTINARAMVQPRPNYSLQATDGPYQWRMQADRWALRESQDTPRRKPAGAYRILALGDSYIYGYSVTQGKTLEDHLESLLPGLLGVSQVEVLNGGIPGGSAYDMLVYYHQVVDQLEPDGVLLGIPHNLGRQLEASGQRQRWYQDVRGAPYLDVRIYLVLRRLIAPLVRARYAPPPPSSPNVAQQQDLVTLAQDVHRRAIPLWVIEWPRHWEGLERERQPAFAWKDVFEPFGARFIGHALNQRSCWGFQDKGHPSEVGQRALAEVAAPVIAGKLSLERFASVPSCDELPGDAPGRGAFAGWRD